MIFVCRLLLSSAVLLILGCSASDPTPREEAEAGPPVTNAASTIAVDKMAEAVADPQPSTIGPYTWAPGERPDDPSSVTPKYVKCWAGLRATPSPDFPNPNDSLRGPVEVAYLRDLKVAGHKLLHDDWTGRVVAVTAGPTARVTVYPNENFSGESQVIEPGETLRVKKARLDQIASLRIEYIP